ncbi:MAG: hypothetical protein NVSMB2_01280 [Chloroflexota bacterium]
MLERLQVNDYISYLIGVLGVLVGGVPSFYFYRKAKIDAEHFGERSRRRRIETYLNGPIAELVGRLIARTLYEHLPSGAANAFARAWMCRIIESLPDQPTIDDATVVQQARLLIEQVYIDLIQAPSGRRVIPEEWPGQTEEQHMAALQNTYLRAKAYFATPQPHVITTSFALQALTQSTPPISTYFEALNESDLPVGVLGGRDRFVSSVRVESGFVAPLHLLTGLLTESDSDWPRVLAQFKTSITKFPLPATISDAQPDMMLEHVQAFQFYCWLLWGPSVQLCTCDAWKAKVKVLQYGYGDENNSLNLIFDDPNLIRESWAELQKALFENGRPYGLAVQTVLIATPMWGPSLSAELKFPWLFNPLESDDAHKNMGLLLRCDQPLDAHNPLLQSLPYYSAYVWIMFEICDPNDRLRHWRKQPWRYFFPVYEHGNIADGTSYMFAKQALVGKAVSMIQTIEDSFTPTRAQSDVYLRYVCAIDDPGGPIADGHELEFMHTVNGQADSIRGLLRAATQTDASRWPHLFDDPDPSSADMFIDSACHLSYIVENFYAAQATRG